MDVKQALYGLGLEELRKFTEAEKIPRYRAAQVLPWLYRTHITSFDEARNLPASFREKLASHFILSSLEFVEVRRSGEDKSSKFLFRTRDGNFLESVLILDSKEPLGGKERRTVCVSTQIGCKMSCAFCASGKGKFVRNLTAGEIIEQVVWIEKFSDLRITNVVFMGMGEPLDNLEEVLKAIRILQAPWGFKLGARRITVSTVGVIPKILEFVEKTQGRVRLSVSLHSAREATRSALVPINAHYPLKDLIRVMTHVHWDLKREITFEYTLIQGVNDSAGEAGDLATLAQSLKAKVNLIPFNPVHEAGFKTPSGEDVETFRRLLESRGVRVTVRHSAARDIGAACGQLRLIQESKTRIKRGSATQI